MNHGDIAFNAAHIFTENQLQLEAFQWRAGFFESRASLARRKAFNLAVKGHENTRRKSGEPYSVHPISVAIYLSDLSMDIDTVIAALLHDLIEDTEITYEDIKTSFGTDVANIVDGVTKLDRIRYNTKEEAQADAIRKMVVAMSKDISGIGIKQKGAGRFIHLDVSEQKDGRPRPHIWSY
mgnify:CR=1 FL=1